MLIVPDAAAAVAWYNDALGATELWNLSGVAGLEVQGAPFFLHEANPHNPREDAPGRIGMTSTRIEVFVDDPDEFVARAVAAGALPGSELEDREVPRGTHRQGGFHDPFGHNWSVGDRSPLSRWTAATGSSASAPSSAFAPRGASGALEPRGDPGSPRAWPRRPSARTPCGE